MRLLIIGGNGTIGKKAVAHFSESHEVVMAGRTSGDVKVDISDIHSIHNMLEEAGMYGGIVCIAGDAKWADFNALPKSLLWNWGKAIG